MLNTAIFFGVINFEMEQNKQYEEQVATPLFINQGRPFTQIDQ